MRHAATGRAALLLATSLVLPGMMHAQAGAPETAPTQSGEQPPTPPNGGGGPHRGGPEHRVEMLQNRLGLSADQTTQVRAIFAAERPKMEALRANTTLTEGERRSQAMAIHLSTQSQIRTLLTADQVTKFDAMEAQVRHHRPGPEGAPGTDAPPPPPPQ